MLQLQRKNQHGENGIIGKSLALVSDKNLLNWTIFHSELRERIVGSEREKMITLLKSLELMDSHLLE